MKGRPGYKRPPRKPKPHVKKKTYDLDGLLKHAQVARILYLNKVTPAEFYVIARLCQDHLPPSTIASLQFETCRQKAGQKPRLGHLRGVSLKLARQGYVTETRKRDGIHVEATLKGWTWFMLLLAEMERPIREATVFDWPKKSKFKRNKPGKKAGAVMRRLKLAALAAKRGLSIWERCGLASLPKYQRLKDGAPGSSGPDSSPATSAAPSEPKGRPPARVSSQPPPSSGERT